MPASADQGATPFVSEQTALLSFKTAVVLEVALHYTTELAINV
jgi:hypothetical protein